MSRYISDKIRKLVANRANFSCEYCLLLEKFSYFSFQIEHIISLKHGGETTESNLAYSCQICNVNKGSDLGTFLLNPQELVRFFNPKIDIWSEHFSLDSSGLIIPKTQIAEATIKILELNQVESIIERKELITRKLLQLNR